MYIFPSSQRKSLNFRLNAHKAFLNIFMTGWITFWTMLEVKKKKQYRMHRKLHETNYVWNCFCHKEMITLRSSTQHIALYSILYSDTLSHTLKCLCFRCKVSSYSIKRWCTWHGACFQSECRIACRSQRCCRSMSLPRQPKRRHAARCWPKGPRKMRCHQYWACSCGREAHSHNTETFWSSWK